MPREAHVEGGSNAQAVTSCWAQESPTRTWPWLETEESGHGTDGVDSERVQDSDDFSLR